jgi:hypothetical protein
MTEERFEALACPQTLEAATAPKTLLTYRHIWTGRDRDGDMQYEYYCTWSDGSEGRVPTLRWDRLQGAVELPMDSVEPLTAPKRSQTKAA